MGIIIIMFLLLFIWGISCFLGAAFWWNSYSQHPEFFPFAKRKWRILQVDTYQLAYETYGDKAVRKHVLFNALLIMVVGIIGVVVTTKDFTERVQIVDFPQIQKGDTVSFAEGELTLDRVEKPKSFTAIRFNLDKNRYEEVEVEADMRGESLLLVKTTLTNNGSGMLSIVQEDLKFYAKPVEEGNNIKGHAVVDGYLYHDNAIELAAGESVPVWFWMSLTEEEQSQPLVFVLQYGKTGCVIWFSSFDNDNENEDVRQEWGGVHPKRENIYKQQQ